VSVQAQLGKMLRGLNLRYEKKFVRPGLMLEPKPVTTATSHAQEKTIRTQRLVRDQSQIWHGGTDMGRFRPGRQHAGTRWPSTLSWNVHDAFNIDQVMLMLASRRLPLSKTS